ncbi:hypothetical protein SLEP1_g20168 [Rubroshorea leprosula]|uniref:Uncharacterized protein n=1 Tax=Rubroshorea leprosula TaxID=152421 RepID=A0AAV5J9D5_9ROSI|nr:hypothetical protein SLEP1_g20168 [Rubroshorea leprosula]
MDPGTGSIEPRCWVSLALRTRRLLGFFEPNRGFFGTQA